MADILARIDDVLANCAPGPFDDTYWESVENRPMTCHYCGCSIAEAPSSTGWTHVGTWQGVRCPGMLVGATPVAR